MASRESGIGKLFGSLVVLVIAGGLIFLKVYAKAQRAEKNDQADAALFADYKEKARSLFALSKECSRDQQYTDWALDQFHPVAWDNVSIKIGVSKAHVDGHGYRTELCKLFAEQALKDNRPELSQAVEALDKAAAGVTNEWYELRPGVKKVK